MAKKRVDVFGSDGQKIGFADFDKPTERKTETVFVGKSKMPWKIITVPKEELAAEIDRIEREASTGEILTVELRDGRTVHAHFEPPEHGRQRARHEREIEVCALVYEIERAGNVRFKEGAHVGPISQTFNLWRGKDIGTFFEFASETLAPELCALEPVAAQKTNAKPGRAPAYTPEQRARMRALREGKRPDGTPRSWTDVANMMNKECPGLDLNETKARHAAAPLKK